VVRLGARDVGAEGRDVRTGLGALALEGALFEPAPDHDPLEPNDDMPLVNGSFFERAAAPLSSGRQASITGTIDPYEDPVDVHRIKVPTGRAVRVRLRPALGNPDLYLFSGKATSLRDDRLLGRSRRGGGRTDAVSIRNRSPRKMLIYAAVGFSSASAPGLDGAGYTLSVKPR
jgi:hypothetical protein